MRKRPLAVAMAAGEQLPLRRTLSEIEPGYGGHMPLYIEEVEKLTS